jgi:Putative Flp pilus-assembly TadE/G-like
MMWLQRLRRDEEGQALVLAAVFGLVLMLCVLSTVHVGRTVYEKMQLQNAADSAAYSQAAMEARVLNFTAYTNRAMVVHYASILAATAYLTWAHFLATAIGPLLRLGRAVPYAGPLFMAVDRVARALVRVLDAGVALLSPLLSSANLALWALQEAAWAAMTARLARMPPEAHSGEPARSTVRELMPELMHAANAAVFARTRGSASLAQDVAQSARILVNHRDDGVQLARAHMMEIANAARSAWVAYGDRWEHPSASPLARHARWNVPCPLFGGSVAIRVVARTELGGPPPGTGTARATNAQIFSGQRLQVDTGCRGLPSRSVSLFQLVAIDQVFATVPPFEHYEASVGRATGLLGEVIARLTGGDPQLGGGRTAPVPAERPFWLSPYVSFAPQARSTPGGVTGPLGNFAQPDVVVALAADDGRPDDPDRRRFTSALGGRVDFRLGATGGPASLLFGRGLTAIAAAQTYYHRPGDWREMPNLFNPLWAARLMPVAESNAAAMVPGLAHLPRLLH